MEDVRGRPAHRSVHERLRQPVDGGNANAGPWGARSALRQSSALLSWKLDEFFDRYVAVPKATVEKTRSAAKEFVKALQPKLDGNKYNIKFRNAIVYAGGCHGLPPRQQVGSRCVAYLPLRIAKYRSRHAEPGYCHVRLPKAPTFERYAELRSADNARLLSPMAAYRICHEVVCHHAKSIDGVQVLPLLSNTSDYGEGTSHIVVVLADDCRVEIVPSLLLPRSQDGGEGALVVAKPYCHDADPRSDVLWRYSFRASETALMQSVSMADGGVRIRSVAILLTMFERDPALSPLGPYALQTLILQTVDKDVEESLTWQRDRQHNCVLSALEDCLECVQRKCMGHFFISNFNVLQAVPDEVLTRLGRRLSRLLWNPNELLRLLEASPAAAR